MNYEEELAELLTKMDDESIYEDEVLCTLICVVGITYLFKKNHPEMSFNDAAVRVLRYLEVPDEMLNDLL